MQSYSRDTRMDHFCSLFRRRGPCRPGRHAARSRLVAVEHGRILWPVERIGRICRRARRARSLAVPPIVQDTGTTTFIPQLLVGARIDREKSLPYNSLICHLAHENRAVQDGLVA